LSITWLLVSVSDDSGSVELGSVVAALTGVVIAKPATMEAVAIGTASHNLSVLKGFEFLLIPK